MQASPRALLLKLLRDGMRTRADSIVLSKSQILPLLMSYFLGLVLAPTPPAHHAPHRNYDVDAITAAFRSLGSGAGGGLLGSGGGGGGGGGGGKDEDAAEEAMRKFALSMGYGGPVDGTMGGAATEDAQQVALCHGVLDLLDRTARIRAACKHLVLYGAGLQWSREAAASVAATAAASLAGAVSAAGSYACSPAYSSSTYELRRIPTSTSSSLPRLRRSLIFVSNLVR